MKVERFAEAMDHLPDLVVDGNERYSCRACGESGELWHRAEPLLELVRKTLIAKPRALSPGEFRRLRTMVHPVAQEFARLIGVTPEIVSKWESGKKPIPTATDLLVRSLVSLRWRLRVDPLKAFGTIDQEDDSPIVGRFVLEGEVWTWREGGAVRRRSGRVSPAAALAVLRSEVKTRKRLPLPIAVELKGTRAPSAAQPPSRSTDGARVKSAARRSAALRA